MTVTQSLSCTKAAENVSDCTASTLPRKASPSPTVPSSLFRNLCFGKEVKVETKGQDRYQRTIADVILPDGKVLNYEIVKAGLAWWFRRYAPKVTLEGLEFQAREAKRGLWVLRDPVPPWEVRRNKPLAYRETE